MKFGLGPNLGLFTLVAGLSLASAITDRNDAVVSLCPWT